MTGGIGIGARKRLQGLGDFVYRHGRWNVTISSPTHAKVLRRHGVFDGVINFSADVAELEPWAEAGVPVVNLATQAIDARWPSLVLNHTAIGRLAAQHLLDRRIPHYACFGDAGRSATPLRLKGFAESVEAAGFACDRETAPARGLHIVVHRDSRITGWLSSLPRPVGLFVTSDSLAHDMLKVSRVCGLRVPDDVAIVGVDNDPVLTTLSKPTLSSIMLPSRRMACCACRLLDRWMAGSPPPLETRFSQPIAVRIRQSSDVLSIDDELVVDAYRFRPPL